MKHPLLFTIILIVFGLVPMNILAQGDSTIVDIMNGDSSNQVHIEQPIGLNQRLIHEEILEVDETHTPQKTKIVGFRIQVFADNNPHTAKNEALVKERNIISRFPTLGTYLTYKAPVWRLRVGDFRTQAEAQEILQEIRKVLPTYAKECIIVRDRVNVIQ